MVRTYNCRDLVVTESEREEYNSFFENNNYNLNSRQKEVTFKLLKKYFKKFYIGKTIDVNTTFEEPTIIIKPIINNGVSSHSADLSNIIRVTYNNISGYKYSRLTTTNRVYAPMNTTIIRLKRNSVVFGDYYPEKNLVLIYFNAIDTYTKLSIIFHFKVILETCFTKHNIKIENQFNSEEYKRKQKERSVELFLQKIKYKITENTNKILDLNATIDRKSKEIISQYGEIKMKDKENESLVIFHDNIKTEIFNQLLQIKELHFVKDVQLVEKGIEVDIGDISLKNKNEKLVYIGSFKIIISPDDVLFYNKYEMDYKNQHPHILNHKPCLGSYKEGINKLLGNFELKRLVFMTYQFLNTYTSTSTFNRSNLTNWASFRKKENKFDEYGRILNDIKIKNKK